MPTLKLKCSVLLVMYSYVAKHPLQNELIHWEEFTTCFVTKAISISNINTMPKYVSYKETEIIWTIILLSVIHILGIGYDFITQLVLPHAAHWKEIGILLDVDSKQLEELEQTCPNDFIRCCKEMINKWLQSDRNVSQRKLFASIKLATVTPLQISQTHKMLNGIDL